MARYLFITASKVCSCGGGLPAAGAHCATPVVGTVGTILYVFPIEHRALCPTVRSAHGREKIGKGLSGIIAVADPIKPSMPNALHALRAEGIRIVMLTGDNRRTAEAVARKLSIEDVVADVLPEDKNQVVKKPRAEGRVVAMVGDGVNDAPALAAAAVGIAMGTGTDVAIQSAGVTLVKGDLAGIT